LTCSAIDSCDTSQINTTCREYINGKNGYIILGVEVRRCKEVVTKAGKTPGSRMAFLSISDSTGKIDEVICFPEAYKESCSLLKEGNTVLIHGERDRKSNALLVKKVFQI
jgi:DNA polymerase III alpha subunit